MIKVLKSYNQFVVKGQIRNQQGMYGVSSGEWT